jgi:beta-glucosidase/6-phospho-beta-glucosidase/beta-galactosidase
MYLISLMSMIHLTYHADVDDDLEVAFGFSKRFGLVWVDYPTSRPVPKDSFRWYSDVARSRALPPAATGLLAGTAAGF